MTAAAPRDLIQAFRNSFEPRIAVTVDMIITGTDIKPIEIVMFMRAVRSRVLFEQMKGRGVRVIDPAELRGVTPDARAKTHFVIVDCVGVSDLPLADTRPLERNRAVPVKALLEHAAMGGTDPAMLSSLAGRRARSGFRSCAGRAPGCGTRGHPARRVGRRQPDGAGRGGGIHVSAETARRLACDAATVTMRHGPGGEILDVGRRTRTISPALRRALAARDRRCRFPGCGNRRVDAHHIRHWADGGRTALDNLILLCRRHHRAVHEEGFRVTMDAAGDVRFAHPDGRPLVEAPPAPAWAGPALQPTDDALAAAGIEIGTDTATPSWGGERLDLDWAMHVLWRPRREPTAE